MSTDIDVLVAKMNIRLGLFRLWVVAAATWEIGVAVLWIVEGGRGDALLLLGFAIVPPIGVLAIGIAGFWIVRGFKEPPTSN